MTENPADRLDRIMNERRLDLDLDWKEVADLAGISVQTLNAVRKGENRPTERTQRRIDRALQWEQGEGVAAILAGSEPTPIERPPGTWSQPTARPTIEELTARVAANEQEISALRAELERVRRDSGGQGRETG